MVIKLQFLFKATATAQAIAKVTQWLLAHAIKVTGVGSRSLSAVIEADDVPQVFGLPLGHNDTFAASPQLAPSLPVPADLSDAVESITVASRPDLHAGDKP